MLVVRAWNSVQHHVAMHTVMHECDEHDKTLTCWLHNTTPIPTHSILSHHRIAWYPIPSHPIASHRMHTLPK